MSSIKESFKGVIMVVDDDPSVRDFLRMSLENAGLTVLEEENAKQALKTLESEIPDLILLDVMMPDMDGFKLCKIITSKPTLANVPVIFVSAYVQSDALKKAVASGAKGFIEKPLLHEDLIRLVSNALKGHFLMPTHLKKVA